MNRSTRTTFSFGTLLSAALLVSSMTASHGQAAGSVNLTPVESVSPDGGSEDVTLGNGATAIMGISSSIGATGSSFGQHDRIPEIADGNPGTNETTYYTGNPDSYAGFTFAGPVTVTDLQVVFSTYSNGGWFGNASAGDPSSSQTLGDNGVGGVPFLLEPTVQVLYSGAATWTTVGDSSNYLTAMSNVSGNGASDTPTVDFALNSAAGNVVGIRVIGATGGNDGGDVDGFLGVSEEAAYGTAPEPSTWAMMAISLAALAFGFRFVRNRA